MGLPYGQNDKQTPLKTLHSRTSLIINYCCYRDNGDFNQRNKPSLNVCCNSWCSWSNRSVSCRSVCVPAIYHQVHTLAPHILWKEQLECVNNSHNGIVTPIKVFPKCFHWIRWIKWQKYFCHYSKRTRIHLLCKSPGWYHSTSKTHLRDRIFKLNPIHASFSEFLVHLGKTPLAYFAMTTVFMQQCRACRGSCLLYPAGTREKSDRSQNIRKLCVSNILIS